MRISPAARAFAAVAGTGLSLAIAAAVALGWLSEEVLEGDTSRFDAYARSAIHGYASSTLTTVMQIFTALGSTSILGSVFVAVAMLLWLRHRRVAAAVLVITMAGSVLLVESLKLGFHRPRPVPFFGITAPGSFSYPSGHSLSSFAFFSVLSYLLAARLSKRWTRVLVWLLAIALIGLVGLSRIYLGLHYPTDVVAGYLTAFVWVIAVTTGHRVYCRHDPAGAH
jgi:undecaprenyl-diphosphatase